MAYTDKNEILSKEGIVGISSGISFIASLIIGYIHYKTEMSSVERIFSSRSTMFYVGESIGIACVYWAILFVIIYIALYVIKFAYFIIINPIGKICVSIVKRQKEKKFRIKKKVRI